jgi:prepilin peptidase CpaA
MAWLIALAAPAVFGPIWCLTVPTWWGSLSAFVLLALLATCAVTDTWQRRIPNWATYSAVLWGLALNLWASLAGPSDAGSTRLMGPEMLGAIGIADATAGLGVALAIGLPVYFAGMIAAGDIKLAAAIAVLLGWKLGLLAICTSLILAGAAAACWTIWLLGPLSALEWLVRTVGFQLLPAVIAPPAEELRTPLAQPMPLGVFFAAGVPVALISAGVS